MKVQRARGDLPPPGRTLGASVAESKQNRWITHVVDLPDAWPPAAQVFVF